MGPTKGCFGIDIDRGTAPHRVHNLHHCRTKLHPLANQRGLLERRVGLQHDVKPEPAHVGRGVCGFGKAGDRCRAPKSEQSMFTVRGVRERALGNPHQARRPRRLVADKLRKEGINVMAAVGAVHVGADNKLSVMMDVETCAVEPAVKRCQRFGLHLLQEQSLFLPESRGQLVMLRVPVSDGIEAVVRKMLASLEMHGVPACPGQTFDREMPE